MAGNSFGRFLVLTTFGESHGAAIGGVLDGLPAGLSPDPLFIRSELDRRKPGGAFYSSPRKEADVVEFLSGLYEGKTTGAPLAFLIRNTDARPADYQPLEEVYRPSHADYTWEAKYGLRDPRGGGRSSARETAVRVAAGALAKTFLATRDMVVHGRVAAIGPFHLEGPAEEIPAEVLRFLDRLKEEGDTTGGLVECAITGVPAGLGEPVFDRLQADLAKAMLSINAVKGFEFGSGFAGSAMKGSDHNDPFVFRDGRIRTATNHSGGIQGGISNGEEILFRVAFKPVATLKRTQTSVDRKGNPVEIRAGGRHDVCVVPRAVVIVEAMAALVIADHLLRSGK